MSRKERFTIRKSGPGVGTSIAAAFRDRHLGTLSGIPRSLQRKNADKFSMRAFKMPAPADGDTLLDMPIHTSGDVVKDLGLDDATANEWRRFVESAVHTSPHEPILRQQLMERLRLETWDTELRKVVFKRAMSLHRNSYAKAVLTPDELRKGVEGATVTIYTPEQLAKGEARGGTYTHRVPRKSGKGHTYYYSGEEYAKRKDAHHSGEEMTKRAIGKGLDSALDTAGDNGCSVDDLKKMAKKHGKAFTSTLSKRCGKDGDMDYTKGRFYRRKSQAK